MAANPRSSSTLRSSNGYLLQDWLADTHSSAVAGETSNCNSIRMVYNATNDKLHPLQSLSSAQRPSNGASWPIQSN